MDPTETYLEMYYAMRDDERAKAREHALRHKDWFDAGGHSPPRYTKTAVKAYMFSVLSRTIDLCRLKTTRYGNRCRRRADSG